MELSTWVSGASLNQESQGKLGPPGSGPHCVVLASLVAVHWCYTTTRKCLQHLLTSDHALRHSREGTLPTPQALLSWTCHGDGLLIILEPSCLVTLSYWLRVCSLSRGQDMGEVLAKDMSVCPRSHLVAARFFMTPFLHIDTGPRKEWTPFGKQVPGHDGGLLRDCCCTEIR
jgi:hypothetical protein